MAPVVLAVEAVAMGQGRGQGRGQGQDQGQGQGFPVPDAAIFLLIYRKFRSTILVEASKVICPQPFGSP
jgi:hypothetical protein